MNKTNLRNAILSGIEAPHIGPNQAQAVPDPVRLQTKELQAAIDALSARGGGRLTLPAGVYRTGALRLRSGVELHLASPDTYVQFTAQSPEENYPLVFSYWEASPCYNYSALLYACDAEDIAVTGPGILDGGADGSHWWNWHHQVEDSWSENKPDLQLEDRKALRRMNQEGLPVEQRIFGPGHWLRPNFFQTIRCRRVLLQGVTLRNSPMWQLNPVQCQSVIVDGVTLSSHGANNDGCDPESCNGVWIKNCCFDTGDDCISLKSGRDRDGREANIPCENILIEHNEFADGHGGVALGSEMSGGIRRVLACDNRFSSPNLTYALRLKTNAKRGGKVEQIMLCDSVMEHVHGAAVHGTMLYEDGRNGSDLPVFRDITIENITAHGGDYGIFLEAFPEVPITGLELRNIVIDGASQALRSMNWQDAVVENVVINGKRFPRPGYVRILGVPAPGGS
ncbi:MAG: glycoside hydrolase family 28 protein, partial [Faecousia sp.]